MRPSDITDGIAAGLKDRSDHAFDASMRPSDITDGIKSGALPRPRRWRMPQ